MRMQDVDLLKLLPIFMREDPAVTGLARGSNETIKALAARIALLSRWDKIDSMDHAELDELAWERNILWYESMASLEAKRKIVRESDQVYATLGTKWAIESMLSAYFDEVRVSEWYEYGGQPHHFKITSSDPSMMGSKKEKFLYLLEIVKRKSSWLESVHITMTGQLPIYTGIIIAGRSMETCHVGTQVRYVNTLDIRMGVIIAGRSVETNRIGTRIRYEPLIAIHTGIIIGDYTRETTRILAK